MQNQLHRQLYSQETYVEKPYLQETYLEQPYSQEPDSQEPDTQEPDTQEPDTQQPYSQQPYSQQPNVIHQQQRYAGRHPYFRATSPRIVGILQLILGLIILGTQIALHVMGAEVYEVCSGYWAAPFFLVAGVIGIRSSVTESNFQFVLTMMLSIVCFALSIGSTMQGIFGLLASHIDRSFIPYEGDRSFTVIYACHEDISVKLVPAFFWIMMSLGVMEGIVAIKAYQLGNKGYEHFYKRSPGGKNPFYLATPARIVGILQLILGLIIFVTQIAVHVMGAKGYEVFSGYWAAVFFIMAGVIGIRSSITKSPVTVVSTMVLSILSAMLSPGPIIQGISGVIHQGVDKRLCAKFLNFSVHYGDTGFEGIYACHPDISTSVVKLVLAFFWIMLIVGIIEGIVAIVASAICCGGCCCRSSVWEVHTNPGYTAQMTIQNHYPYNGNTLPTTDLRGYPRMLLGLPLGYEVRPATINNQYLYNGNQLPTFLEGYSGSPLGYAEGPAHAADDQPPAHAADDQPPAYKK